MSRVPMGSDGGAWALDPQTSFDTGFVPQGVGADLIATLDGVSREAVDRFALASHQKAAQAWTEGRFAQSVIPVKDALGETILAMDEHIKPGTTLEALGQLKAAFEAMGALGFDELVKSRYPQVEQVRHIHTAGNSSGIVDGAALVLVGNERAVARHGFVPRAKVLSTALAGDDPMIMLTAPALAARKALERAGLEAGDIDLYEVNEAFASVVLRFARVMDVPLEKINVNGGAIAMGHPLGATGAMLIGTLLDELERRGLRRGMVTLCVGGGMGIATIIERV
jgi:acetyl-CoA C-acetyltransferase